MYVEKGAKISLTCLVNYMPEDPASSFIFWYHNDRLINYDSNERGVDVNVRTERRHDENDTGSMLSSLLISSVTHRDAGNYSCKLHSPVMSSAIGAPTVTIYILNAGEKPAAMHRGDKAKYDVVHVHNRSTNNMMFNSQIDRHIVWCLTSLTTILIWFSSSLRVMR